MMEFVKPLFKSGCLYMTNEIEEKFSRFKEGYLYDLMYKHLTGDWGTLCKESWKMNDEAVKTGEGRIFSLYKTPLGTVYIITEDDRSCTTILFSHEY